MRRITIAIALVALLGTACRRRPRAPEATEAPGGDQPAAATDGDAPALGCADGPGRWIAHASPTTASLHDVHVVSRDDAWIVGEGGTLLHWDGSAWAVAASGSTEDLSAIWTDTSDGWIVGARAILRRDGDAWSAQPIPSLPGVAVLSALGARSASDVWIGGGIASPQVGLLFHHDGAALTPAETEPTGIQVTELAPARDGTIWLVAHLGRVARIRGDGSSEQIEAPTADGTITNVFPIDGDDAFFPGLHGFVHRFHGGRWHSERIGEPDHHYYAAWGTAPGHVWVAGYEGAAAHFDGTAWTLSRLPTAAAVFAIDGTCATDAWAVGAEGTILRLVP